MHILILDGGDRFADSKPINERAFHDLLQRTAPDVTHVVISTISAHNHIAGFSSAFQSNNTLYYDPGLNRKPVPIIYAPDGRPKITEVTMTPRTNII